MLSPHALTILRILAPRTTPMQFMSLRYHAEDHLDAPMDRLTAAVKYRELLQGGYVDRVALVDDAEHHSNHHWAVMITDLCRSALAEADAVSQQARHK